MKNKIVIALVAAAVLGAGYYLYTTNMAGTIGTQGSQKAMSFFITSANPGKGADLGGLAGADTYCTTLAESVGVKGKTWRAYLSTTATSGSSAVNARDRIGEGPWYNAKGELIAANLAELHSENFLNKNTSLNEKGEIVSGRGDTVNMHDILTGSSADGMASSTDVSTDTTCKNWTSSTEGSAIVGHHDRVGINESAPMKSWNSSHGSRGCSIENLKSTGGGGLFYCFAK